MAEQLPFKERVEGSSPSELTMKTKNISRKQVILLKDKTVNETLERVRAFLEQTEQVEKGWTRKRSALILEVVEDELHPKY